MSWDYYIYNASTQKFEKTTMEEGIEKTYSNDNMQLLSYKKGGRIFLLDETICDWVYLIDSSLTDKFYNMLENSMKLSLHDYNDFDRFEKIIDDKKIDSIEFCYDGGRLSVSINGVEVVTTSVSYDFSVSINKED